MAVCGLTLPNLRTLHMQLGSPESLAERDGQSAMPKPAHWPKGAAEKPLSFLVRARCEAGCSLITVGCSTALNPR